MRRIRCHGRARAWIGFAALLFASKAHAESPTGVCGRYTVESMAIGMPLSLVRARYGREGVMTNLAREGQPDTTAVEYVIDKQTIYVEYDHRVDRKPEARIATLRIALPPTQESVERLIRRFGPPTVAPERRPDESGETAPDGIVWIDTHCELVAAVYRRSGSWWSGDVGTFFQLDTLDAVRRGRSPASAYVAGTAALAPATATATAAGATAAESAPPPPAADGAAAPPAAAAADPVPADPTPAPAIATSAQAVSFSGVDQLPQRIASAPPIYPANLRLMGVTGRVTLAVTVRTDGTVGDVRVAKAEPPDRGFEPAAVAAVKRWRYKPATLRSVPTEAEVEVVIDFR